jgi:hypothetical protein
MRGSQQDGDRPIEWQSIRRNIEKVFTACRFYDFERLLASDALGNSPDEVDT